MTTTTTQRGRDVGRGRAIVARTVQAVTSKQAAVTGRLMVSFWLDMSKHGERELNEHIVMLKQKRLFSYSIRAGLVLLKSLHEKRLDVLFEMFPWIQERFQSQQIATLAEQIQQLQKQLQHVQMTPLATASMDTFLLPEPAIMEADTQTVSPIAGHAHEAFAASIAGMFDDDDD